LLALSVTPSVPLAGPIVVGENVTLIVQLVLLASVVVQVEPDTEKGPTVEMEMPVNVVGRLFLSVTFLATLVVPTLTLPNARLVGVTVAWATPVPETGTVCGLPGALSATLRIPLAGPIVVGVNVTFTVQP
jgi:hypothetical protein